MEACVHIRRLAFEGLRALPAFEAAGLGRVVPVLGSASGRTALADAITIGLSPFSKADTASAAVSLGLGKDCVIRGESLPEEITIGRPEVAQALFGDARQFKIKIDLELDPPQFGEIRGHAMRDPRLVAALAAHDTTLGVGVGWIFTRDWTVAATSVLGVRLGNLELPLVGDDRPAWLTRFLSGLAGRFVRHRAGSLDESAYALAERSPHPAERAGARRMRETLAGSPFGYGELQVVAGSSIWLGLPKGDDLLPLRSLGPRVAHAVGLVQAVHQSGAEILFAEAPLDLAERRRSMAHWLRAQSLADGSALEQVFLGGVGGKGVLEPR
jgi:hypothetical protein